MSEETNVIQFKHVTKAFPGVKALDDVSFSVKNGEIHALVGENGAGKSTLLNILHGIYADYEGEVQINNETITFKDAKQAIASGIVKVHQEVSMVPELTVGQNIVLGYEPVNGIFLKNNEINQRVNEILDSLNVQFRSEEKASNLSIGEMQMASIAKALYHKAHIISLDEPTASLSAKEISSLFEVMKDLKKQGITIIYISHHLEEIFQICDAITVLRDGKVVDSVRVTDVTKDQLIRMMVGREIDQLKRDRPHAVADDKVLEVKGLTVEGFFEDVSFHLNKGEILGFSGLVGSRRTDIMLTLFGALEKTAGEIRINGKEVDIKSPKQAVKAGIGLVPENRKTQGFNAFFDNSLNIALTTLDKFLNKRFVDYKKIAKNANEFGDKMNLRPNNPNYMTVNLSGGNQQKIVISKWLSADVDILILDEPTKGVDVGAKSEIYDILHQLVTSGKSIIIVSSELPEVLGLSDRIVVMREGKKVIELGNEHLTEEDVIQYVMEG